MEINPNFKKVAIRAAKEAGKVLERHFRKNLKISLKKDSSLVTDADILAEKKIIELVTTNFPSHNILAEESGGEVSKGYTWLIDPLDGTTNYAKGFPFFATSIALLYNQKPILGVVFNPLTKELYFAERGRGAFLNGKPIKVSDQQTLLEGVIIVDRGRLREEFPKFYKVLKKVGGACKTFRYWGAITLELCQTASGRTDGLINTGCNPWDFAAGVLITKEAGAKITDFKGKNWQIDTKNIIVGNKKIHKQFLKLIK